MRHMTVCYAAYPSAPLAGFDVSLTSVAVPLWSAPGPNIRPFKTYQWSGRHVVLDTDTWQFSTSDGANYDLIISGYELALP